MMFKSKNDFCLYLENLKRHLGVDTYMETIIHFYENETDQEMEDIAKLLNKKLIDCIEREGVDIKMIKGHQLEPLI